MLVMPIFIADSVYGLLVFWNTQNANASLCMKYLSQYCNHNHAFSGEKTAADNEIPINVNELYVHEWLNTLKIYQISFCTWVYL